MNGALPFDGQGVLPEGGGGGLGGGEGVGGGPTGGRWMAGASAQGSSGAPEPFMIAHAAGGGLWPLITLSLTIVMFVPDESKQACKIKKLLSYGSAMVCGNIQQHTVVAEVCGIVKVPRKQLLVHRRHPNIHPVGLRWCPCHNI
eukprot:COSAG02_NODE_4905_length_4848_cov_4.913245_5_plen_144_part_00